MIKTDKLLPLINKINQDKKKLNSSKPKYSLPDKTQAKVMSKPIITNQDGQDLFPGLPTMIQGRGAGTSITMRNTNPQIALTPYGAAFMQPNMNYNFAGNNVLELPVAQMGGDPQQDQIMQMIQIYAQMKQMDPNELLKKIQELPQDQQQQALQSISQEVQQAMAQQQEAQAGQEGQEQMPEGEMMSQGGEPCIGCFDNYNPSPQAQNLEWFYKKAKGGLAKARPGGPPGGSGDLNPAHTNPGTIKPYEEQGTYNKIMNVATHPFASLMSLGDKNSTLQNYITEHRYNPIDVALNGAAMYLAHPFSMVYPLVTDQTDPFGEIGSKYITPLVEKIKGAEKKGLNYKKAKGGIALPKHQYGWMGHNNIVEGTREANASPQNRKTALSILTAPFGLDVNGLIGKPKLQGNAPKGNYVAPTGMNPGSAEYENIKKSYLDLVNKGPMFQKQATDLLAKYPVLKTDPYISAGLSLQGAVTKVAENTKKAEEAAAAKAKAAAAKKQAEIKKSLRPGNTTMSGDNTKVASAETKSQELANDIKNYGSIENADRIKTMKKAADESKKQQQQSQVYETIDINPNEYALAAMSSPYTGNDPRIIRDAANQTNRQIAPIATGAGVATGSVLAPIAYKEGVIPVAKETSHILHNIFNASPSWAPRLNLGNVMTVDMLTDAYERAPAWGEAFNKALETGSDEDIQKLKDLSILQGIDLSGITGLPSLMFKGSTRIPKYLYKLKDIVNTVKGVENLKKISQLFDIGKSYEGLVHAGKKYIKHDYHHEDPAVGKWGRYAHALLDLPDVNALSPDQTFIPESTGIYPNYLNIPQSVGTQYYYGNRKVGGEAFPQANEYPTDWASYSGNQYQKGRQTGKKTPNYEPNWFARRTSVPGQVLGALTNFAPWFGSHMLSGANEMINSYQGDQYYVPNTNIPYGDLSQYMINRRYSNIKPIPEYDAIIQNMTPEQLRQLSGPIFKEGGEAFPQAQTYLPYSRLKRFAQGGPDKPVKGKMSTGQEEGISEEEYSQAMAEQAAQQAQAAAIDKRLGPFYTPGSSLNTYETNPSVTNQSGQDIYYTPSYFGATDRYSQTTRPFTLQDAQQIALANNTSAFRPASSPVAVAPQPGTTTAPVASPSSSKSITIDDSKMVMKPAPKTTHSFVYDVAGSSINNPSDELLRQQALKASLGYKLGLANDLNIGVTGNYNVNKDISTASDVAPITNQGFTTGLNVSKKWGDRGGLQGNVDWDTKTGNVTGNVKGTYTIGAKKAAGGSFETRPNFMFAEGGDTDDQFGGQLDIDSIYKIMKAGGFAKDPKKKKGKELSPADFMAYVKSQALKKKVGGEMLTKHDVVGQTGTPTVGTFKDPTGNPDWTYSYNNGVWTAYNKGKAYDISKNPKYQSSIDKLNKAYPGGKDPNAVTNNTSNPTADANNGTTNTATTNQGTTNTGTTDKGNTSTSANPSGVISANPLDYLNMVNSQTGNKGLVGALTSVANAANLVGYLGTGWGSGEKKEKEKEKKPTTPNIPIQQQNENKQAKANFKKELDEYKNHYVYPQSTPEVDPLAGGDFLSGLDQQYPIQQNYTSGYDAYRMEEDGKNPTAVQPKKASTLYTTQDEGTIKPSPKVPLTPPRMLPEDLPTPYEQWKEDANDPNNFNYQFNERGDGVSGVKNPMNINAYPFDFYQPINDNQYQRSYRRGGDIYLPKHATDPIVVSGMQGQGQSINLSQNNNLGQSGFNPYGAWNNQTADSQAIQSQVNKLSEPVQTANQNLTRIADQNVSTGTDTTGGTPSTSSDKKSDAPKFRPGVMDFGEVGSKGKHLTFDVAGASRAVGGLGQIKDYLAGINQRKQADELANKLNTSEFMGMAQMGGMQDMGDYLVNATQGPSFRPNAYTQAQKQSEVRMEQPLLYGRMGGTLDMYEDGEEYDLTQEEIDEILAAGGTVEYI